MQCSRDLDFSPRRTWPAALPALAWNGILICGFERSHGMAVDQEEGSLVEILTACHPQLGLGELARLYDCLSKWNPELTREVRADLLARYGLRWCDRLEQTLRLLVGTPLGFQNFADEKGFSIRDYSPLLSLPQLPLFAAFLEALVGLGLSKSDTVRALELGVELYLLNHPLADLLPSDDQGDEFLGRLERWRRPQALANDESWKSTVAAWPWPAQVQGQWQRFGDQSGLEIKIRTTSPEDLSKKLQRLLSIGDTWSCKM